MADLCSSVRIVKSWSCLSKHTRLLFKPPVSFSNNLLMSGCLFSCMAGRKMLCPCTATLLSFEWRFLLNFGHFTKILCYAVVSAALEMFLLSMLQSCPCVFLLWSHPSYKCVYFVINPSAQSNNLKTWSEWCKTDTCLSAAVDPTADAEGIVLK